MRWFRLHLLSVVAMCAHAAPPYVFVPIDVPGAAATFASSINNAGAICGTYRTTALGASHAFILATGGDFVKFEAPGATTTQATSINDAGQVAGYWSADLAGNVETGYIRSPSGAITNFTWQNASDTNPMGINDAGEMALTTLTEPGPAQAWFMDAYNYTQISAPGIYYLSPNALNNNGFIAGTLTPAPNPDTERTAFIYDLATKAIQTFTIPGSTTAPDAYGINDAGEIGGDYTTGYGAGASSHGYVRLTDGAIVHIDFPGSISTSVHGINDSGDLTGDFEDAEGHPHAFIAARVRSAAMRNLHRRAHHAVPLTDR